MVDRILIGNHPIYGMGGFVSQLGVDVKTANRFQLAWSTEWESLQIVSSGSYSLPDDEEYGATFTWPNLGYYPVILAMYGEHRFQIEYLSTSSARMRVRSDDFPATDGGTAYYVVTRTPKP